KRGGRARPSVPWVISSNGCQLSDVRLLVLRGACPRRKTGSTFPGHALTAGPALPHAELEHGEVDSAQEPAGRGHDFGRSDGGARTQRQHLLTGFDLCGVV